MIEFIVKVQLSLVTSHDQRQCLVYNQKRNLLQEFPASPKILKAMGKHDKRYFNASFDKGELTINEPTKEQAW